MQQSSERLYGNSQPAMPKGNSDGMQASILLCNWNILHRQLLKQWPSLSSDELTVIGPDCRRIANLIAGKYSIAPKVVENYLRNFERTLPLL